MSYLITTTNSASVPMFSAVRHQPVAPKSAAVRRRSIRRAAVMIGIGITLALAYVWIRIQTIQLGYEVSLIRKEASDLKEQKNILEAEVAKLKAPARVETIARERFGMRLPQSSEVVIVSGPGTGNKGSEVADKGSQLQ